MKTSFTLNVNFSVTPELESLIKSIVGIKRTEEEVVKKEAVVECKEAVKEEKAEMKRAVEEVVEEDNRATFPSAQDVRAAMEDCRKRLEFEDGSDEPNADIHRKLTAAFKQIAASIGGTKPSELPENLRDEFIGQTRKLDVINGEVVPF